MKNVLEEFKVFVLRGNTLDFAIGITIGAVFNSVVKSLVNDVIMPPIGYLIGGVDLRDFFITLGPKSYETLNAAQEAGAATLNYGIFINALISILITILAVFFLIKAINVMREKDGSEMGVTAATRPCPYCLTDIPKEAKRCPNCTSEIEVVETKEKPSAST